MLLPSMLLLQALLSVLEVKGQQQPPSISVQDSEEPSQGPLVVLESSTAAANKTDIPVFTPEFVQRELKKVLAKYEEAPSVLQGIGLSPQLNISFVNNFPAFQDPSVYSVPNSTQAFADMFSFVLPVKIPAAKVPITDFISGYLDILYYAFLEFGTPPQKLSVDIDTGSADLWVASNCTECNVDQFDSLASNTSQALNMDFTIEYGAGVVMGTYIKDLVAVDSLEGITQVFGLVDQESSDFAGYPNSGILGLGFGSISVSGQPTLFENMMDNGKLLAPLFSVHLARNARSGSEICFGCYDITKTTGMVQWLPVVSKSYWTVAMNGLKYNSHAVAASNDTVAAIDTGTTLIYVPDNLAKSLYKQIPGAKTTSTFGQGGFYTYPCSSKFTISLTLGGFDFAINEDDFNLGRVSSKSSECVGGILSLGADFPANMSIIGDEFLKSWYSVYDYSNGARVGLAPSINNS